MTSTSPIEKLHGKVQELFDPAGFRVRKAIKGLEEAREMGGVVTRLKPREVTGLSDRSKVFDRTVKDVFEYHEYESLVRVKKTAAVLGVLAGDKVLRDAIWQKITKNNDWSRRLMTDEGLVAIFFRTGIAKNSGYEMVELALPRHGTDNVVYLIESQKLKANKVESKITPYRMREHDSAEFSKEIEDRMLAQLGGWWKTLVSVDAKGHFTKDSSILDAVVRPYPELSSESVIKQLRTLLK